MVVLFIAQQSFRKACKLPASNAVFFSCGIAFFEISTCRFLFLVFGFAQYGLCESWVSDARDTHIGICNCFRLELLVFSTEFLVAT